MFRSLFIGFLILSALASKGVGVQVNQNIQLSADILLHLYNAAAAQADRLAEPAPASTERVVRADAKRGCATYEALLRHTGQDGQFIWFVPADRSSGAFSRRLVVLTADRYFNGAAYTFGSDNSPPYCL